MSVLAGAAFLLALQCGNGVDPDLLAGFATVESGQNPLTVHQNVRGKPGRSFAPSTIEEAEHIAAALIAAGESVDTGTFQINNKNLDLLQISLADTFDTCRAAAAAARLLAIMSRYNSGSPTASLPYAQRVAAAVRAVKDGTSAPTAASAASSTKAPRVDEPLHDAVHVHPMISKDPS